MFKLLRDIINEYGGKDRYDAGDWIVQFPTYEDADEMVAFINGSCVGWAAARTAYSYRADVVIRRNL